MQNPAEEQALLEDLQRRHEERQRGAADPAGSSSSKSSTYPRVDPEELTCAATHCGKVFVVPIAYLAPDRPVGKKPDLCPACVAEADAKIEARLKADEAERAQLAAARGAQDVLARMELAGGNPFAYAEETLEDFKPRAGREKPLEATREWVEAVLSTRDRYARVRGLYLVGETGTAKTALAHCALRAVLDAGLEPETGVLFDDSLTFVERFQGTYGSNENTWALLEKRIQARVWILDDLMSEKPSPDVVRKLTMIFNRREGKPTMVTSNFEPSKLRDLNEDYFRLESRFGPRNFRIVRSKGEDARFERPDVDRVRNL